MLNFIYLRKHKAWPDEARWSVANNSHWCSQELYGTQHLTYCYLPPSTSAKAVNRLLGYKSTNTTEQSRWLHSELPRRRKRKTFIQMASLEFDWIFWWNTPSSWHHHHWPSQVIPLILQCTSGKKMSTYIISFWLFWDLLVAVFGICGRIFKFPFTRGSFKKNQGRKEELITFIKFTPKQ